MSKGRSLALVTLAYVLAIGVAALWLGWGPRTHRLWLDTLIADALATLVIFAFSRAYRNSSFYDAYWSVIPPLLLAYWWWQGPIGVTGPGALRCWLMAVVVGYWAVRLTGNWVYGFPGLHHEDWRYPLLRDGAGRFAVMRAGDGRGGAHRFADSAQDVFAFVHYRFCHHSRKVCGATLGSSRERVHARAGSSRVPLING